MKHLIAIAIAFLAAHAYASNIDLIGGRPVNPGEYPEVVRILSGRFACTSAIVGPRVIITAAHCIDDETGEIEPISSLGQFTGKAGNISFRAICTSAPDYREEVGDQDIALCKTDRPIYVRYASVSDHAPKLEEIVTLTGFGCTQPQGGGGNDGILRTGEAPVTHVGTGSYYSFHTRGSAALCFGDSGGPAYKRISSLTDHIIYGINSRGNIRDLSLMTAVYHPKSIKFMLDFESINSVSICGISADCLTHHCPAFPYKSE